MTYRNQIDSAKARDIMAKRLDGGLASATRVIEHVNTAIPTDRIVPARAMHFTPADKGVEVTYADAKPITIATTKEVASTDPIFGALLAKPVASSGVREGLTKHAFGQLCTRAEVPTTYATRLTQEPWGAELIAHTLQTIFSNAEKGTKFLTRSLNARTHAVLSDAYRRLDSRPQLNAFAAKCMEMGLVPVDGHVTDTQVAIKAVFPEIFEPIPGEPMIFGIMWKNSDFGLGAQELVAYAERLACLNGMISTRHMRQVHLGRRLTEDMAFSQRTYELDSKTVASAISDVVAATCNRDEVENRCAAIKLAHETGIDPKAAEAKLKKDLGQADTIKVLEAFRSADVENMPAGNTAWRLSNAVSWIANQTTETDRKLELQRYAGQLVPVAA